MVTVLLSTECEISWMLHLQRQIASCPCWLEGTEADRPDFKLQLSLGASAAGPLAVSSEQWGTHPPLEIPSSPELLCSMPLKGQLLEILYALFINSSKKTRLNKRQKPGTWDLAVSQPSCLLFPWVCNWNAVHWEWGPLEFADILWLRTKKVLWFQFKINIIKQTRR